MKFCQNHGSTSENEKPDQLESFLLSLHQRQKTTPKSVTRLIPTRNLTKTNHWEIHYYRPTHHKKSTKNRSKQIHHIWNQIEIEVVWYWDQIWGSSVWVFWCVSIFNSLPNYYIDFRRIIPFEKSLRSISPFLYFISNFDCYFGCKWTVCLRYLFLYCMYVVDVYFGLWKIKMRMKELVIEKLVNHWMRIKLGRGLKIDKKLIRLVCFDSMVVI